MLWDEFLNHNYFVLTFAFAYGVTLGSFYNVIIYRVPRDISIAHGRSFCPACECKLSAKDLIPLLSWLFLRGRCRRCGAKISPRYFIIELITGVLFAFAYWTYGFTFECLLYVSLWSMLLITMLMDFDHMIISDPVLAAFSAVGAGCIVMLRWPIMDHVLGAAIGFAVYFAIYFIAKLVYKREAFGFGDVLLMTATGLFLGWRSALLTAFLAFYAGLLFLIAYAVTRKFHMKKEFPFGPSICLAAFATSLFGDKLIEMFVSLMNL